MNSKDWLQIGISLLGLHFLARAVIGLFSVGAVVMQAVFASNAGINEMQQLLMLAPAIGHGVAAYFLIAKCRWIADLLMNRMGPERTPPEAQAAPQAASAQPDWLAMGTGLLGLLTLTQAAQPLGSWIAQTSARAGSSANIQFHWMPGGMALAHAAVGCLLIFYCASIAQWIRSRIGSPQQTPKR